MIGLISEQVLISFGTIILSSLLGGGAAAWFLYPRRRKQVLEAELANNRVSSVGEMADMYEESVHKRMLTLENINEKLDALQTKFEEGQAREAEMRKDIRNLESEKSRMERAINALLRYSLEDNDEIRKIRAEWTS